MVDGFIFGVVVFFLFIALVVAEQVIKIVFGEE